MKTKASCKIVQTIDGHTVITKGRIIARKHDVRAVIDDLSCILAGLAGSRSEERVSTAIKLLEGAFDELLLAERLFTK
jgi:hypothetical protein